MTYKWNPERAKTYAQRLSKKLSSAYFEENHSISGAEVLKFTPIKQLNLLVIRNLYEKWEEESQRVKSPYFNFEAEEVQKSFKDFKNILSRHIQMSKEVFTPLLQNSIVDLLQMHLDTANFFEKVLKNLPDFRLTEEWLKQNGKYYTSFSWVLAELLERLQGMPVVYANQAIDWAEEIIAERKVIDSKDLDLLHSLEELTSLASTENASFFDDLGDNSFEEIPNQKVDQVFTPEPELVSVEVEKKNISLNDRHFGASKTLNEQVLTTNTLSDSHSKTRIGSIRSAISLNQRFLFINNLFGGDVQSFTLALDELEASASFDNAREKMLKKYRPKYNWDIASPEAEEFFDLLKRRF